MTIPIMSLDEVKSYIDEKGVMPPSEIMIKAPTTWIPIKPSNPSKLTLHWFDNGVWRPTFHTKFVNWPKACP